MIGNKVDVATTDLKLKRHGIGKRDEPDSDDSDGDESENEFVNSLAEKLAMGGGANLTKSEAERVKENYLAKKHQLDYETKSGRLIDRQQVEKLIFEKARIERDAWLNWPSRMSAVIAAEIGCDKNKLAIALEKFVRQHLADRSKADNVA